MHLPWRKAVDARFLHRKPSARLQLLRLAWRPPAGPSVSHPTWRTRPQSPGHPRRTQQGRAGDGGGCPRAQGDCLPLGREACRALAAACDRPMLFALSEPGVLTPEDAFEWMGGQAIFTDARLVRPVPPPSATSGAGLRSPAPTTLRTSRGAVSKANRSSSAGSHPRGPPGIATTAACGPDGWQHA